MADEYLTESPTWVDLIYQIKTTDLVIGGPDGISNRQARELGNRTAWLKAQLESNIDSLAAHAAGRDHPAATNALLGLIRLSTLAEALAGTDANTAMSPAMVKAAVDQAVTALIDSSPATLDTLAELAAALGNDADFAATITAALAAKAPLASPEFTGTPTVPTAAPGTNNTQAASTAFVVAALTAGGYLKGDTAATLTAGYFTAPVVVAIAGGHAVLDVAEGNVFTIAVNGDFTLDFPAGMAGKAGMMLVVATQDGTGHTLTLASGLTLAAGEWSITPGAVNLLWITSDGSGAALDVVISQRGA